MSDIHVREASEFDVFAIEEIMRASFEASYAHFMPEQYVREFFDENRAAKVARSGWNSVAVAEIMGRICGFVMYQDNTVNELWVHPDDMGRGVGSALLDHAEERIREKRFPTATLYCYEPNEKALAFYGKRRYRKTSSFPSTDVAGGPVTVLTLVKMLKRK
ncbi:GNAT family N-acetyltransferase [Pseudodesulfovibrio tunisiensis]|uniref:GNAT family N-acetyltransferase n=1 Tax=Pseudodesulfovibrio tunisiensis TaxID=463192 RepID=UPI001FB5289F|nr:GNAT family N-acetyltransferase [Pseudodesulfovibrio tunisiensis]